MSTAYMTPEQILRAVVRATLTAIYEQGEFVLRDAGEFVFRGNDERTSDFLTGFLYARYGRRPVSASADTTSVNAEAEPKEAEAPAAEDADRH